MSFVKTDHHPKNNKERLDTLKRMIAHTQVMKFSIVICVNKCFYFQYCVSGDNTVESLQFAIKELAAKKDDFDETVVILVSDANLER